MGNLWKRIWDRLTDQTIISQKSNGRSAQSISGSGHRVMQINDVVWIDNVKVEMPGGVRSVVIKQSGRVYANGRLIDLAELKKKQLEPKK